MIRQKDTTAHGYRIEDALITSTSLCPRIPAHIVYH